MFKNIYKCAIYRIFKSPKSRLKMNFVVEGLVPGLCKGLGSFSSMSLRRTILMSFLYVKCAPVRLSNVPPPTIFFRKLTIK